MKKSIFLLASVFLLNHSLEAQVQTLPPSYREDQTNKMDIYRAEAEKINALVHTKLDLKFDYAKQHVLGEAWLTLKPYFYPTNRLVLDAKAMVIHEVSLVSGNSKKKLKFTNNDFQLFIDLDKEYHRNQEYTLYINYTARPNEVKQEGSAAISDAKGLYFINPDGSDATKPTQIWTQGETESSSCWFPTIDKPNQKTSQEIYLTYPEKYVSLSNGLLKSTKKNNDGTKTDYWKFDYKHAPYLFFIGIGDYAIIKDKWKNVEVNYYVEPEYKDYAKDIFGNTPEMIEFFSNKLDYPFPWDKYHQITARDYVSGAMENTGAVLFLEQIQQKPGQLIDENKFEYIIAHELFHHWFGDLVTTESWSHLTVNESFANYSEYLWYEHKYGKEKAEEHRWGEIEGYNTPENFDKILVRMHYNSREDMFDGVSYNKGGAIIHMLRNYLGDEAFFKGLNLYLNENKFGTAEAVQLRLALEKVSGRDLNWFFNQWYNDSGHPKLNLAYDYNQSTKKISVNVKQEGTKFFEFPFAIDVVVNGKATRHQVWVSKKAINTFTFDASQKPDVVIPNADEVLLCDLKDNKSIEEFIAQYKAGTGNYGVRRRAIEALADAQNTNDKALDALLAATADSFDGLRMVALNNLDAQSLKIKEKAIPVLKNLVQNEAKTKVQALAVEMLNFMDAVDAPMYEKLTKSKSYAVQAAAINGILKNNPNRVAEFTQVDDEVIASSNALVVAMLPSWIAQNDLKKSNLVAESVAFYEFAKFQNPAQAEVLEKGFNWVMSHDTPSATKKIAQLYSSYYTYLQNNQPQAAPFIKRMAENALRLKSDAFASTKSSALEKQMKDLQNVIDKMK
ncbi:M1 family metallopeptidase [Vaginella massiliensis]|uniref:M1 family metallopeptidase n=1 Tax=Vaginella massiliensis TaxID=1816680 RepID=UPI000838A53D|nr:M1 family metallopeptidase [Vaginella massiliensis]